MSAAVPRVRNWRGLLAVMFLCLAFGSIHSFSVLLVPLQTWFGSSRLAVSSGYSIAIASLTLGVFASGRLQRHVAPALIATACGLLSAAGLMLGALWKVPVAFLLGYGLAFGLANGFAYSLSLAEAAKAVPNAASWALGLATAIYGLGSILFAQVLGWLTSVFTPPIVLTVLALLVGAASLAAAMLFARSAAISAASGNPPSAPSGPIITPLSISMLWFVYFCGACGGLMVIAHAAEIFEDGMANHERSTLVPSLVALGSVAGGYLGGLLAERHPSHTCIAIPLFAQTCALGLLLTGYWLVGLAAVLICGLCYGTLISVVPSIIRSRCGDAGFPSVFGIVFTAWGLAGLCGPLTAGAIFDMSGDYSNAILLALVMAGTGCALSLSPSK